MTRNPESPDVLDLLADYAPSDDTIAAEWSSTVTSDTLARIVGSHGSIDGAKSSQPVHEVPLHFLPNSSRHRRRTSLLPVAAAVAVTALIVGIIAAVAHSSGGGRPAAAGGTAGPPFDPPAGLSDTALAAGQYYYQVDEQLDVGANGQPDPAGRDAMVNRNYVAPNGDIVSFRTGSQTGCHILTFSAGLSFSQPDRAFFAAMPTEITALTAYFRGHVDGSSSHNEAVFVAVGDALRTAGGLASPRLRAAMLAVLSRTPGVLLHMDQRDHLGRPAIRADFVDQKIRPGEVHAYYFDPTTFAFLEERFAANGQPTQYSGPSPAYSAPAGAADDPEELTGAGFVDLIRTATIVDELPTIPTDCKRN